MLSIMLAFNYIVRIFASRDANSRNLWVGQQCLAHALSHIIDSDGVGLILRYAVFSSRAKSENVPVKQINFNPAILRVLEHPLPMRDFLVPSLLMHRLVPAPRTLIEGFLHRIRPKPRGDPAGE